MSEGDLKHIVWLASYPKSGNTWLRMFIQAYMTGHTCQLNDPFKAIRTDTDVLAYRSVSPVSLPDNRPEVIMGLRFPALLHLIQQANGGDVLLKTHNVYAANVDGQHLCPPGLTKIAVYIIRDPRDIAISFSKHLSRSIDETIDFMCNENGHLVNEEIGFGHHLSSWSNHTSAWVANGKPFPVCTVRYEWLVDNPRKCFYDIVKFLFKDVDEKKLDFAIESSSFENLKKQEQENGFNEQKGSEPFFRVGKVGQWKSVLSSEQVERLEAGLGETMERMGYKCVTREPSVIEETSNV